MVTVLASARVTELKLLEDLKRQLALLHSEKEKVATAAAMHKAELDARALSEEKAIREAAEVKVTLDELLKEQEEKKKSAPAMPDLLNLHQNQPDVLESEVCKAFEAEARSARAAAEDAQSKLSSVEQERRRAEEEKNKLEKEAQMWCDKFHAANTKLEAFSREAAVISKEAIERAAQMDIAREKSRLLQEEEKNRFSKLEAELAELRRMVAEQEKMDSNPYRPEEIIGQTVRLFGLTGAKHLNDRVGMCTGQDKATGRFLVQLRGPDASTVKVKGMNLEINSEPSRFMWQQVRLVGLVGAAHLNGRIGVCSEMDRQSGRLVVVLDGDDEKTVKVREENLEELSEREKEEYEAEKVREMREKAVQEEKRRAEERALKQQQQEEERERRAREAEAAAERQRAAEEAQRQEEETARRAKEDALRQKREREQQEAAEAAERLLQEEEQRKQAELENQALLDAFSNMRSAAEEEKTAQEAAMRAEAERRREEQQQRMEEKHRQREEERRQREEEQRLAQERYRQEAWERHLGEVNKLLNEKALGVSIGFLHKLMNRFNCGALSTYEVVSGILMQQTQPHQCSYAQFVMIQEATPQHLVEFSRATHYVSHAWKGNFGELVAALSHWLAMDWDGQRDAVYFYLDIIAVNQHVPVWGGYQGSPALGPDQVVGEKVRACGRLLVVLAPFNQPIVYRRMWVLFEVASAVLGKASVAACVSPADADYLSAALQGDMDPVRGALATLDGKTAETSVVHDRSVLLIHIKKKIKFDKLNDLVADAMRTWLISAGYRQLAWEEDHNGAETPAVAALLNNIATLLKNQGKATEAERLFLRAIAVQEKLLGADHPDVGLIVSNLAGLMKQCGRMAEAAPLIRRYLNIHEKAAKRDNRQYAMQLNLLAKALRMEGRYDEARELYERSLAVREECLGKWHPNVATSLNNLGSMLTSIGVYADAEPLLQRALEIDRKVYGMEHPRVATDFNNLAVLYNAMGRVPEAESLCHQAVRIIQNASGLLNDPDIAAILNTLGWIYGCSNRAEEGDEYFDRALHICTENRFGDDHPITMRVKAGFFTNTARRALAAGLVDDARVSLAAARPLLEQVRGKLHYETKALYALLAELDKHEAAGYR